jgi:hypothetical protein
MMNAKGYDPNNLQTLATFLAYGEHQGRVFDMEFFSEWGRQPTSFLGRVREAIHHDCGSVGCAIGWATMIWPKPLLESFGKYSSRLFISEFARGDMWEWCFGSEWATVDNSPLGAAQRIQYLIENEGDPESWDYDTESVSLYKDISVLRSETEAVSDPAWPEILENHPPKATTKCSASGGVTTGKSDTR